MGFEEGQALDVLVNNAGLGNRGPLEYDGTDQWRGMLDANVLGLSICTREAIREMEGKEDAQIINISSIYAHRPHIADAGFYTATKHAVRALTDGFRVEMIARGYKIKMGMISPGATATEFREVATGGALKVDSYFEEFHPLLADDVAQAALYMLSTPRHVQINDIVLSPVGDAI